VKSANTTLTRRDLLKVMGVGTATLALAACAPVGAPAAAPQGGEAAPSAQKVTLRLASWDSKNAEPIEADVLAAFAKQFPDIGVTLEFNPDAYDDKLLTSMAGGTGPDVFMWWNFPGLAAKGGIQDLTDLVSGPSPLDLNIYFKEVLDYNRFGPGLYGLPKDFTPRAFYFNQTLFDEAGVPYPTADWTTEDMLAIAQKLTKGEGADKQYGVYSFSDTYAQQGYIWQAGGDYISPDGKKASGHCDSEATTSVIDWQAALNLKHGVAPTAQSVASQQGGADQLFIGGKLGMYDTGRWPQAQFKKVDGLKFGTVLPPMDAQTKKRVVVLHEAGFCINPASKFKGNEAWELTKFESGAEAQTIRTKAGWAVPALPAVVKELNLMEDPLEKTWFEAVPFATVPPCFMRTTQWDSANSELQNAVDSVFLGKATSAEAMSAAAPIVDGILAEA